MGHSLRGWSLLILGSVVMLAGCESTSPHRLPPYEAPLARADFQTVRTTAYTDTEADHLAYTNHNALGGILHAANAPVSPGLMVASAAPATRDPDDAAELISGVGRAPAAADALRGLPMARPVAAARPARSAPAVTRPVAPAETADNPPWMAAYLKRKAQQQDAASRANFYLTPPAGPSYRPAVVYGSAAADWSRWPVGTVFQIRSTGQVYKVDDYGWALAGRNTIDLYHASTSAMNAWGVRHEPIQILQWGSRSESLRLLQNHQGYKHIRRMVLELQGHDRAAAALE